MSPLTPLVLDHQVRRECECECSIRFIKSIFTSPPSQFHLILDLLVAVFALPIRDSSCHFRYRSLFPIFIT